SSTLSGGSASNASSPFSGSRGSITARDAGTQCELTSIPILGCSAVQRQTPGRISSTSWAYTCLERVRSTRRIEILVDVITLGIDLAAQPKNTSACAV